MTFTVWDAENNCILNLSKPDLGAPHLPGRWEQLREIQDERGLRGVLACPDFSTHPSGPEWMHLVEWADGTRLARHYNHNVEHPPAGEGDEHKAMKDRTAERAERAGFRAELEARSVDGGRRTDVLIHGQGGLLLGVEPQFYRIAKAGKNGLQARTDKAVKDGITPLWITNTPVSTLSGRKQEREFYTTAPWARIAPLNWQAIRNEREQMPVRGGVRLLEMERCGTRSTTCPLTGRKPCGQRHPEWEPHVLPYDDLIIGSAGAEWVPVWDVRNKSFWWVRSQDRARYLGTGFQELWAERHEAQAWERGSASTRQREEQPDDLTCRYGRDLTPDAVRTRLGAAEPNAEPAPELAPPPAPAVASRPTVILDWTARGPEGAARVGPSAPCSVCGQPTMMRSPSGEVMHKVCAERVAR